MNWLAFRSRSKIRQRQALRHADKHSELSVEERRTLKAACRTSSANLQRIHRHAMSGQDHAASSLAATLLNSFNARLAAVLVAAKTKKACLSFADMECLANSINFDEVCGEPTLICAKPKTSGGYRVVQSFGVHATARQLIGRDLLMAMGSENEFEFCFAGRGLGKLLPAIKHQCLRGFTYWIEADVKSCFASLKPKHFEYLPLPQSLKAHTLLSSTGKLILTGKANHADGAAIVKAARQGLPEGATSSSFLASAFLGRELRTLVSEAKVVVFMYMDNIIIGAREEMVLETFAQAIVEHFHSLRAGPLHLKVGPIEHLDTGVNILGWRLQAWKSGFYLKTRHSPNGRSFSRFAAKLAERLPNWSLDKLVSEATEYAEHWCSAHFWSPDEDGLLDLLIIANDLCEVEAFRRKSILSGSLCAVPAKLF